MKKLKRDSAEFFPKSGGSVSKILQMKWEYTARREASQRVRVVGNWETGTPFHEHLVCHTLHFGILTSTRPPPAL